MWNLLGLRRSKIASFSYLKEKIQGRLKDWMARTISKAGRTTHIKSMIQSIPINAMSTYKLPKTFCSLLDKVSRKFWWLGAEINDRFLAFVSWKTICYSKWNGGLGLRQFEEINDGLLSKLGWLLASGSEMMWANLLRLKYCAQNKFTEVAKSLVDSRVCRDILSTEKFVKEHTSYIVGSGDSVKVVEEKWAFFDRLLPRQSGAKVIIMVDKLF